MVALKKVRGRNKHRRVVRKTTKPVQDRSCDGPFLAHDCSFVGPLKVLKVLSTAGYVEIIERLAQSVSNKQGGREATNDSELRLSLTFRPKMMTLDSLTRLFVLRLHKTKPIYKREI